MRVISGSARGKKLIAPEGLDTRPTTDRVKESLFNIINPYIPARSVLDLFAGSGALGIEALSRASDRCVFVESDRRAFSVVCENVKAARLTERAETVQGDYETYLARAKEKFDVIFLDPPYNKGILTKAIKLIEKNDLLGKGGIIAAESEFKGEEPPECGYELIKRVKYGKTEIYILKNV